MVMACIVMAYMAMAYMVMADVQAQALFAGSEHERHFYIVMACIVMAYIWPV